MIKIFMLSALSFLLVTTDHDVIETQQETFIELFDIEQGEVLKKVSYHSVIQSEVESLLTNINGIVKDISPIPATGFIVKIPLQPHVTVHNEWFHDLVDEVFVFYSPKTEPFILLFDQENRPYFFTLAHDATSLLFLLQ